MKTVELLKSKEYLKLDYDEQSGYMIEFRLNRGKGTSPICIPINVFDDIIRVLEDGPKVVHESNIVDIVRNSLTYDFNENGEEVVSFRTRYGRGSKIHKIRKEEYIDVIAALKEISKDVPEVIAAYEDPNR